VSRLTLRVAQPSDEAAPRAAMRCCRTPAGAHNLTIAARLVSSDALPASTMLAAATGCDGRSTRKLVPLAAGRKQSACFFPAVLAMLGAGQWEKNAYRMGLLAPIYFSIM
jgi:hypothetical protein